MKLERHGLAIVLGLFLVGVCDAQDKVADAKKKLQEHADKSKEKLDKDKKIDDEEKAARKQKIDEANQSGQNALDKVGTNDNAHILLKAYTDAINIGFNGVFPRGNLHVGV